MLIIVLGVMILAGGIVSAARLNRTTKYSITLPDETTGTELSGSYSVSVTGVRNGDMDVTSDFYDAEINMDVEVYQNASEEAGDQRKLYYYEKKAE